MLSTVVTAAMCVLGCQSSDPPSTGPDGSTGDAAFRQETLAGELKRAVAAAETPQSPAGPEELARSTGALQTTMRSVAGRLPTDSEARTLLANALQEARDTSGLSKRQAVLMEGAREALATLQFSQSVSAPLPADFPPPSPVGRIRVKEYPKLRKAVMTGSDEGRMFRTLFKHIRSEQIKMTAPMQTVYEYKPTSEEPGQPERKAMAFYYQSLEQGQTGRAGDVKVMDEQPQTVVSVGVRGSYSSGRARAAIGTLSDWLKLHSDEYRQVDNPRVLAYHSPMVPWFMKYSEVQIPVERVTAAE